MAPMMQEVRGPRDKRSSAWKRRWALRQMVRNTIDENRKGIEEVRAWQQKHQQ